MSDGVLTRDATASKNTAGIKERIETIQLKLEKGSKLINKLDTFFF